MKISLATSLALSLFAATSSLATPSAGDFRHQAMASDAFEIASSKIALGQSENGRVKEFAQMMIHDHTLTTQHLLSGTGTTNADVDAKVAPGPDGKHKSNDLIDQSHTDTLDKLGSEKGKDFDSDYMSAQVSGHKDAVDLFTDFARHGKNRHLRLWARKTLPTLKKHLARAESLNKGM
jgi:putative membrane protein